MFDTHKVEIEWGGRPLTLETGKVARQADGAVIATYGETTVLATVVSAKSPKPGQDFFPLTVNYQEKTYAAGKIPGGYFKREGRPSENETLTSRLIDRPMRPLFADGYKNDTQVIITVLQHDLENNPDILALVAASAALTISGIPFMGPIAGARVGYINGDYVLNPHVDEMPESSLDLVVAGTSDAVLMVESEAKELAEDVMLGAVMFGHKSFQPVIDAIIKLAEAAAKEPRDFTARIIPNSKPKCSDMCEADLRAAYTIADKAARYAAIDAGQGQGQGALRTGRGRRAPLHVRSHRRRLQVAAGQGRARPILETKSRIDGRDLSTVRPIVSEVGFCRVPTVRRCSPAVKPRPSSLPRSAPATTSSIVDSLTKAPTRNLHAALQLPALLGR
jgi:polyribonucleotide nucleotidyltransferase